MDFTARDRLRFLTGATGLLLGSCGGGGSNVHTPISTPPTPPPPAIPQPPPYTPVAGLYRDTFRNNFKVGAAIQTNQIDGAGADIDVLKSQFNAVTAEYEMKPDTIAPTEGAFNFAPADKIVDFAIANNMEVRGHALLWHSTTPEYFLTGTKAQIKAKLEFYITTVMTHFKGRIKAWDVVNEVVTDNADTPTAPYRNSNWYQAVGSAEYIDWAFNAARAADPDAKLFINEYNTELAGKRSRLITIVSDLIARGIPLDAVGHQFHIKVNTPASSVAAAIDAVDAQFAGLENHVTELDISVYVDPGSCFQNQGGCAPDYGQSVPPAIIRQQAQLYRDIFDIFIFRPSVTSVTTWGIDDSQSWLNTFFATRSDYPLLFDRARMAKPAFRAITDSSYVI